MSGNGPELFLLAMIGGIIMFSSGITADFTTNPKIRKVAVYLGFPLGVLHLLPGIFHLWIIAIAGH